jgi:plastocyanin
VRFVSLFIVLALTGCTPGAPPAGTGTAAIAATTTIDVSLSTLTVTATQFGSAGGFTPPVTDVTVGSTIRFINADAATPHTSTSLSGSSFPASSPFGANALSASGTTLSGGWSTGTLGGGNGSQILLADKAGTYLYGCAYHYGTPMRGAIVVH